MIESERRRYIVDIIRIAKAKLKDKEWNILKLYCIDGLSNVAIGETLDMPESTVRYVIDRLPYKLAGIIPSDIYINTYVALTDNPSTTEASTPQYQVGWLVELLPKLEVSAGFREIKHKKWTEKKYEAVVECRIPEYLQNSFRNRPIPVCTLCGNKCSRKEANVNDRVKQDI